MYLESAKWKQIPPWCTCPRRMLQTVPHEARFVAVGSKGFATTFGNEPSSLPRYVPSKSGHTYYGSTVARFFQNIQRTLEYSWFLDVELIFPILRYSKAFVLICFENCRNSIKIILQYFWDIYVFLTIFILSKISNKSFNILGFYIRLLFSILRYFKYVY